MNFTFFYCKILSLCDLISPVPLYLSIYCCHLYLIIFVIVIEFGRAYDVFFLYISVCMYIVSFIYFRYCTYHFFGLISPMSRTLIIFLIIRIRQQYLNFSI